MLYNTYDFYYYISYAGAAVKTIYIYNGSQKSGLSRTNIRPNTRRSSDDGHKYKIYYNYEIIVFISKDDLKKIKLNHFETPDPFCFR